MRPLSFTQPMNSMLRGSLTEGLDMLEMVILYTYEVLVGMSVKGNLVWLLA